MFTIWVEKTGTIFSMVSNLNVKTDSAVRYSTGGYWLPSVPGTCQHCGSAFVGKEGQRFCNKECSGAGRRTLKPRQCENCGETFQPRLSTNKVCSKKCQYGLMTKRSQAKLHRTCVICGTRFIASSKRPNQKTCSKECLLKLMSRNSKGRKASAETRAKQSASIKVAYSDPVRSAKWKAAARDGIKRWHSDPDNAALAARRSSERMKERHQDPEFQKRRDERSSRVMKENWERYRDRFMEAATERYLRHRENGEGIWSEDSIERKAVAAKWIMKKAQEALHAETPIDEKMSELQYRLRLEMPYDGPQDGSEYADYCQKLCRAILAHPEYRAIADPFMSEAIPRFAEEWQRRKVDA